MVRRVIDLMKCFARFGTICTNGTKLPKASDMSISGYFIEKFKASIKIRF